MASKDEVGRAIDVLEADLAEELGSPSRAAELIVFVRVLDEQMRRAGGQLTPETMLPGVLALAEANPSEHETKVMDELIVRHLAAMDGWMA